LPRAANTLAPPLGSDPPFFHNALDRATDAGTHAPTDRQIVQGTIARCAPRATRANNSDNSKYHNCVISQGLKTIKIDTADQTEMTDSAWLCVSLFCCCTTTMMTTVAHAVAVQYLH